MSGHGFHVHGPHDHELEHAASGGHGNDHGHGASNAEDTAGQGGMSMTSKIAVCTAVIATVGAIFSYMGGATQANAGLYKNNAAIKKTEASNQWNYFQSKSTKQALAEFARDTATDDTRRQGWQVKVARYEQEKTDIQTAARKLEDDATRWDAQSEEQMHQHHRWAQATTVLQVSIALAAMALLTRKKWLERGMFGVAAAGLAIGVLAALHI
jgi:Na+/glutamate symporter